MASCPQMAKTQHSCSCIDHFVFPYILPCQLVKTTDNLPANKGCPAVSNASVFCLVFECLPGLRLNNYCKRNTRNTRNWHIGPEGPYSHVVVVAERMLCPVIPKHTDICFADGRFKIYEIH